MAKVCGSPCILGQIIVDFLLRKWTVTGIVEGEDEFETSTVSRIKHGVHAILVGGIIIGEVEGEAIYVSFLGLLDILIEVGTVIVLRVTNLQAVSMSSIELANGATYHEVSKNCLCCNTQAEQAA